MARVSAWVEEERLTAEESERREREEREQEEREQRAREELEELERMRARGSPMPPPMESEDTQMRDEDHGEFQQHHPPPPASSSSPPPPPKTTTSTDRSGLCVICQDQEANIAIVDCGCVPSLFVISFRSHLIWLFSLTLIPT